MCPSQLYKYIMMEPRSLNISLLKVESVSLPEGTRLKISIKSIHGITKMSSIKATRKNVANFYRESVAFPILASSFTFKVINADTDHVMSIHKADLSNQLGCLSRKNVYQSVKNEFKLTWEAQLVTSSKDYIQQRTEREITQIKDAMEGCINLISCLQPSKKIREKRRLSEKNSKNEDAISQPSQICQKAAQLTMDTLAKKKSSLMLQKIPNIKSIADRLNYNHKQLSPRNRMLQKSTNGPNKNSKLFQQKAEVRDRQPDRSPKKSSKCQSPPQKFARRLRRCRSGLLEQIGLKQILSTAIVGVISGITAAHF